MAHNIKVKELIRNVVEWREWSEQREYSYSSDFGS